MLSFATHSWSTNDHRLFPTNYDGYSPSLFLALSLSLSLSLVWHNSQTDRGNNSAQIQLDFIDD